MDINKDHFIIPLLLMGLVAWRVVRRIRRNTGRHLVHPGRMTVRIVLFSLITLMFAAVSPHTLPFMMGLGAGLVAGALLGLLGVHLTHFENTDEGRFFTPNTYLGIAVSFLFVARLVYRLTLLYAIVHETEHKESALGQSALTLFSYALLAGYYITYYIGVFIRSETVSAAKKNA